MTDDTVILDTVFHAEEFEDRLHRVRTVMTKRGVDVMVTHIPENIFYLSGYRTPGYYAYQCLAVPMEDDPLLVVRLLETTNAAALSYVRDYVGYRDTEDPVAVAVAAMRDRGLFGGSVGVERDGLFPSPAQCSQLTAAVGEERVVDGSGVIESCRFRKSAAELALIRQASAAANAGIAQALQTIAPGVTENEVALACYDGAIRAGSEYMSAPPMVTSGPRSALAHSTWEGRTIEEGDVVFLELSGNIKRYSGALMRTAVAGRATREQKRVAQAVIDGLSAAIATMKPGVTSHEVNRACRGPIEEAGLGHYFLHRTGYSIGVNYGPDWGEGHIASLRDGDPLVLEPNTVFHLVPAVMLSGVGGIGFSETVLVTDDGAEPLGTLERRLFECGT